MRYAEYPPDPRLAAVVRCHWVFEAGLGAQREQPLPSDTVVPDGHPELIFHYGGRFSAALGADADSAALRPQPLHLFAGQLTRPLTLRGDGAVGMLGVRFQPWGGRVLGLPATETADRWIGIDDLPERAFAALGDDISAARDDHARIALVERVLIERIRRSEWEPDPIAMRLVGRLRAARAPLRQRALAVEWGMSERQFERRINDAIGVPPKRLASILRFRALFDALQASPHPLWLDAALAAGYFDQAHMIRDFRRIAGAPPRAFMQSLGALSTALLEPSTA
jgi:AraC-like DNA-binding protein